MPRYDLYKGAGATPYYLDVQSDFHHSLHTCILIPLVATHTIKNPNKRLHVAIDVHGAPHLAVVSMMAAFPKRQLGKPVANAADHSHDITTAIDFLLQGF